MSPSQGRYLRTAQQKNRINAYTDIHVLSGIRTNDPSVRASEDKSCLRRVFLNRRALASVIPGPRLTEKRIYRAAV
jgi:hypothetical protein